MVSLVTFVTTELVHEPASMTAIAIGVLLSVALDLGWKRRRDSQGRSAEPIS
ncbi:hypothetical protein D3C83_225570 [compost metagenome]